MQEQASKLALVVSVFKLDGGTRAVAASGVPRVAKPAAAAPRAAKISPPPPPLPRMLAAAAAASDWEQF